MKTLRRSESDSQCALGLALAGPDGGGEHVAVFRVVQHHGLDAIGCTDEGFRRLFFDIRLPMASPKKWEVPDNGLLTFCYLSADIRSLYSR